MTSCPRCGAANGCAVAAAALAGCDAATAGREAPPTCWCASLTVPAAQLAAWRAEGTAATCFCRACLCDAAAPGGRSDTAPSPVASAAAVR